MSKEYPGKVARRFAYEVTDDGHITRMQAICKRCGQRITAASRKALDEWEDSHVCPPDTSVQE